MVQYQPNQRVDLTDKLAQSARHRLHSTGTGVVHPVDLCQQSEQPQQSASERTDNDNSRRTDDSRKPSGQ